MSDKNISENIIQNDTKEVTGFEDARRKYPKQVAFYDNIYSDKLEGFKFKISNELSDSDRAKNWLLDEITMYDRLFYADTIQRMIIALRKPLSQSTPILNAVYEAEKERLKHKSTENIKGEEQILNNFLNTGKFDIVQFLIDTEGKERPDLMPLFESLKGNSVEGSHKSLEIFSVRLSFMIKYREALKDLYERHYGKQKESAKSTLYWNDKKGNKVNLVRLIHSLYELKMIKNEDGTIPSEKLVMAELGDFFNLDLSDYTNDLNTAVKASQNANLAFFRNLEKPMIKRWEKYNESNN